MVAGRHSTFTMMEAQRHPLCSLLSCSPHRDAPRFTYSQSQTLLLSSSISKGFRVVREVCELTWEWVDSERRQPGRAEAQSDPLTR